MDGRMFVANDWRPAADGRTLDMTSPSDGQVIGTVARGGKADVDEAVAAARAAFEGRWGRTPAVDRGRLLTRIGMAVLDHAEELAAIEAADTGKPMQQARADVIACARYFEFFGGAADKLHGETIPFLDGYQVMVLRQPRGVTGHIIPWNYPLQMAGRTLGASLAAGNCAVLKPAEEACLSVLRLTEIAAGVGVPKGVVNVVPGLGEEAGAALAAHAGIDFLSFTGSPEVGTLVQKAASEHHVACVLELGGKSPQLVFADADLDAAVPVIANAVVQNAGQTCSAGSRALIAAEVYDKAMEKLAARFSNLVAGHHEKDLDCGALINQGQIQRVQGFLSRAAESGITVGAEGLIDRDAPASGFYVKPTLFDRVPPDHELAQEEVFGPVLAAIPFRSEDEAVSLANGTDYGLVAGVWTADGGRQMRLAKAIRAGQVFVNGYGAGGGIELPFGGVKRSGHGREKGFEALREFTVTKTVVFNHG